jgi:hypothetical protein
VHNDKKMFRWLALLIFVPLLLAVFGGDRFRYPCQDPKNWHTAQCTKPQCEINRQCPEHIFDKDDAVIEIIERQAAAKGATQK